MVYRVYVEKKAGLQNQAEELKKECSELLGVKGLTGLRILNRYDAENLSEELFESAVFGVFAEPQLDNVYRELPKEGVIFAVEYLPGQFDQRADSAAQCIQILSCGVKPDIRTAKVYVLEGNVSKEDVEAVKKHVINPVESREADLALPATLATEYHIPEAVATVTGFCGFDKAKLEAFGKEFSLAMDLDDLLFCQAYFVKVGRDPTVTEIKVIDTYWSDHCRHTTFLTTVDSVRTDDPVLQAAYENYLAGREEIGRTKPVNLMDIGTLAAKVLRKRGLLEKLDQSEEINACTVKIDVTVNGKKEPWLLLFKNETHNHPTEIEPFGGAATCIGGAIRDPLSGRSYVYAAMRVTGAGDPTVPLSETLKGKLPQRTIVRTAANGYSSYGNQIGLATGLVDEIYHPGYVAKRMEIGAVIAAAPQENVRRETPAPGDVIILLGGRTGRDGIGGATGSSKAHDVSSVKTCGAEVQKGNAPEERKLQRLFRNPTACKMIKRCNDFGAGGVSVAIGELADGLLVNLNAVPKKYEGLDGTELAISESQERMAVVVAESDVKAFMQIAYSENLEATAVATVTAEPRLRLVWNGKTIVDISREFLNSNGAEKHIDVTLSNCGKVEKAPVKNFADGYAELLSDLNVCSKRGLSERFDSTIGAGTVLMPFGGKYQLTPIQAMVQKISVEKGETEDCSFMAYGYNPYVSEKSPYHGAYLAVVESVAKLVAAGADLNDAYLTFQEYFEKPKKDPKRWGKPMSALLGAYKAQMDLGIAAIGGKDSMSGSFEKLDVPPTLVSFAVTTGKVNDVISPEFKAAGHSAVLIAPEYGADGLPVVSSLKACFKKVNDLARAGKIYAAYTVGYGGVAEAVAKMCMGNGFGFSYEKALSLKDIFGYNYGAFVVETDDKAAGILLGAVTADRKICYQGECLDTSSLFEKYESKLEKVYPVMENREVKTYPNVSFDKRNTSSPCVKTARPKALIPVFPGTNCEYDTAKQLEEAGAEAKIFIVNNLTAADISRSVDEFAKEIEDSQIIFIPGGFSGGDEPDGSGKFIMSFFRNQAIKENVHKLLNQRDGLMGGICNGFQALIKLGLVPYGKIIDTDESCPTLTFNTIARHQSKLVRIRVASTLSPWFAYTNVGDVYTVPISHGEGKFLASDEVIETLRKNGQIATQYVDLAGNATDDVRFNPNDSALAIEGITSPDGRVFGKMGHSERIGRGLYKNVDGVYDMKLFKAAVDYFKK